MAKIDMRNVQVPIVEIPDDEAAKLERAGLALGAIAGSVVAGNQAFCESHELWGDCGLACTFAGASGSDIAVTFSCTHQNCRNDSSKAGPVTLGSAVELRDSIHRLLDE